MRILTTSDETVHSFSQVSKHCPETQITALVSLKRVTKKKCRFCIKSAKSTVLQFGQIGEWKLHFQIYLTLDSYLILYKIKLVFALEIVVWVKYVWLFWLL